MKTVIKLLSTTLLIAAISCTKEGIKTQSASATNESLSTQTIYHIGEKHGGGIIFYLDSSKQHGLIAALSDQGTNVSWYNGTYISTGALAKAIGTGLANTKKIINKQGSGTYAAKVCRNYHGGGFTDWYLPSKDELNQMYKQKSKIGGFEATNYWSSTESNTNNAYDQEFGGGFKFTDDKSFTVHVRAIRSF